MAILAVSRANALSHETEETKKAFAQILACLHLFHVCAHVFQLLHTPLEWSSSQSRSHKGSRCSAIGEIWPRLFSNLPQSLCMFGLLETFLWNDDFCVSWVLFLILILAPVHYSSLGADLVKQTQKPLGVHIKWFLKWSEGEHGLFQNKLLFLYWKFDVVWLFTFNYTNSSSPHHFYILHYLSILFLLLSLCSRQEV